MLPDKINLQGWMDERICPPIFEKCLAAVGEIFSDRRLLNHLKSSNIIMSFLQHRVNDGLPFPGAIVKSFLFSSLKVSDIFITKYVVEDGRDRIHADTVSSRVVKPSTSIATNITSKVSKNMREAEPSTYIATNIKLKRKRTKSKKISEKSVKKVDTAPLVTRGATSRKQLFSLVPLKKENYKSHISSVFNSLQTIPLLWKLVLLSLETDNDEFTIACHNKPTALASLMLECAMKVESIESMKKSKEPKCVKMNTFDNVLTQSLTISISNLNSAIPFKRTYLAKLIQECENLNSELDKLMSIKISQNRKCIVCKKKFCWKKWYMHHLSLIYWKKIRLFMNWLKMVYVTSPHNIWRTRNAQIVVFLFNQFIR